MWRIWWQRVLAMIAVTACVPAGAAWAQANAPALTLDVAATRARAERGEAEAQYALGRMYLDGEGVSQDHVQSVVWFRKAAAQGHARSQNNLGLAFQNGLGVPKDDVQAVAWYRKAAEQGEMLAQSNLGVMYSNGSGVPQDLSQAAAWYRRAADQGFAPAQFYLGTMYEGGRGVPQDPVQAVAWYRRAADQGFAAAQFFLGQSYVNGHGVPQDDAAGVSWYRKAAEQNYAFALYNLGQMYQAGRGVPHDPVEAYKWLALGVETEAATDGQQKTLAQSREALGRSLTAEQRAEAERRAREWASAFALRQTPRESTSSTTEPLLQLADVKVTPDHVRPGASFRLDIAYTAKALAASHSVAVTLHFSILSSGSTLFESPGETVESTNGEAWTISKPLTASTAVGNYVLRVRLTLGATVVTRDVDFVIAR